MAKINFPASPTNGQPYSINGVYYYYDSIIGAWVTSLVARPLDASLNTQINFNDSGYSNGSNGMTFSKTANTVYFNNVAITQNVSASYISTSQNVSASYFVGNGSLLTGITTTTITNDTTGAGTYYPIFTTTSSGQLAIANTSTTKLYFVPSTGTLSATTFNSLSDRQFKDNIEDFDGEGLLDKIDPVTFTWKETNARSYGVVAQDLERHIPELVSTNNQGIKSVSYDPMIAILIDVIKKQQKQISEIKKVLNSRK
jgi:hypothetical protein